MIFKNATGFLRAENDGSTGGGSSSSRGSHPSSLDAFSSRLGGSPPSPESALASALLGPTASPVPPSSAPGTSPAGDIDIDFGEAASPDLSEEALKAWQALFKIDNSPLHHVIRGMTVIKSTPDELHLTSLTESGDTRNTYVATRDSVTAVASDISAEEAFEMVALVLGNPSLANDLLEVTGSDQDRYVLTLAAASAGLRVKNPFLESNIADADRGKFTRLRARWEELAAGANMKPAEPVATPRPSYEVALPH